MGSTAAEGPRGGDIRQGGKSGAHPSEKSPCNGSVRQGFAPAAHSLARQGLSYFPWVPVRCANPAVRAGGVAHRLRPSLAWTAGPPPAPLAPSAGGRPGRGGGLVHNRSPCAHRHSTLATPSHPLPAHPLRTPNVTPMAHVNFSGHWPNRVAMAKWISRTNWDCDAGPLPA